MFKFFVIFLTITLYEYSHSYQCKNQLNEPVDWAILYKFPRNSHSSNKLIAKGLAYSFITSADSDKKWTMSSVPIDNINSIPGFTLRPLYNDNTSMYILYNDEPPNSEVDNRKGHTKGVLLSNESSGIWIIHSVPHFPSEDSYGYPSTGEHYGQSFICISFNLKNIDSVGRQLQYNNPHIYKSNLPTAIKDKLPNIASVIEGSLIMEPPWYNLVKLSSVKGEEFLSFAKSSKFGKDLYVDWIANELSSDLLVESWLNGPGRLPSLCNRTYKVHNIQHITFESQLSFKSSADHSKWAISNSTNDIHSWVCIGDINREEAQKFRGGGTICLSQIHVWNAYNDIITNIEQCDTTM